MKKILILLLFISLISCSTGDDTPSSYTEILPIESVSMPDEFIRNQIHVIDLFYYKPSSCHLYSDIYYVANTNERTVAIVSEVYFSNDCQEIWTEAEASFNFKPTELGVYVFKFWQGEDDFGEDHYYIVEIEVVD